MKLTGRLWLFAAVAISTAPTHPSQPGIDQAMANVWVCVSEVFEASAAVRLGALGVVGSELPEELEEQVLKGAVLSKDAYDRLWFAVADLAQALKGEDLIALTYRGSVEGAKAPGDTCPPAER